MVQLQTQTQTLRMTPQLQMAIKLLQYSRQELRQHLRSELDGNPLLEDESEGTSSSEDDGLSSIELQDSVDAHLAEAQAASDRALFDEVVATDAITPDRIDWDTYLQQQSLSAPIPQGGIRRDDDFSPEANLTQTDTLQDHLLWQLRLTTMAGIARPVAEYVIRSLTAAGYLRGSTQQIASQTDCSTMRTEIVLRQIQHFDPLSIASRSLAEALWIQVRHPGSRIEDPLVQAIICRHLPTLSNRAYSRISKDTGEATEEVYEAIKQILQLEPRPARAFVSEEPHYVTPDVYVHENDGQYVVSSNDDGMPRLRISRALQRVRARGGTTKKYVDERLRSAEFLVQAILQRQQTILKVTRSIVKFQREFFEHGPQHLRPLILKEVAEDIGVHESTVSRVTANKYVHTPQGLLRLKYFFNASITREQGENLASEAVKTKIWKLIEAENPQDPLSDQKLVTLLRDDGVVIARRTVAKYREQLKVLSSSKRRKPF